MPRCNSDGRRRKRRRSPSPRPTGNEALTWEKLEEPGAPDPPSWKQEDGKVPKTVTVASDCAGLLSEAAALDLLDVPHKHLFASELDKAVRQLMYSMHGKTSMRYYKAAAKRRNAEAPRAHLYVVGFPCQPFSPAGRGRGLGDSRSDVLLNCLEYVKLRKPRVFIAENSHRLASAKCPPFWRNTYPTTLNPRN
jgi:hypothetical protein